MQKVIVTNSNYVRQMVPSDWTSTDLSLDHGNQEIIDAQFVGNQGRKELQLFVTANTLKNLNVHVSIPPFSEVCMPKPQQGDTVLEVLYSGAREITSYPKWGATLPEPPRG